MKRSLQSSWSFDWLQVSAIALLVIISASLMGLADSDRSQAGIYDLKTPLAVQAELTSTQPPYLVQNADQWVARFRLTAETNEPVNITSLSFYPQGSLLSSINRYLTLYRLYVTSQTKVVGRGETWLRSDDGYLIQTVTLDQPVTVDYLHPLEFDVYVDSLQYQYNQTFGIFLAGVTSDTPISVTGLPLSGRFYSILERI